MPQFNDQLINAAFENRASDPGGTPATGRFWANTTSALFKWWNGSAIKTLVETDTAQVITAKDVDGGTASNTSRITLPKAATATLNALTRKQGTVVYDTDTNMVKYDDGTTLTALAAGDNTLLSNDAVSANYTINSGFTLVKPRTTVETGITLTVTGTLFSPQYVAGPGTIAGAGTIIS